MLNLSLAAELFLIDILNSTQVQEAYISDMNSDLINAYQVIKDGVDELILELERKQDAYLPLDSDRRKEYFYAQREEPSTL